MVCSSGRWAARIVGEVFIGLLQSDPDSYLNAAAGLPARPPDQDRPPGRLPDGRLPAASPESTPAAGGNRVGPVMLRATPGATRAVAVTASDQTGRATTRSSSRRCGPTRCRSGSRCPRRQCPQRRHLSVGHEQQEHHAYESPEVETDQIPLIREKATQRWRYEEAPSQVPLSTTGAVLVNQPEPAASGRAAARRVVPRPRGSRKRRQTRGTDGGQVERSADGPDWPWPGVPPAALGREPTRRPPMRLA